MVLLEVKHSDGSIGRCDSRCYDSKKPKCVCVCGGRNHGVGLSQARLNTESMLESEIMHSKKTNPGDTLILKKKNCMVQKEMFL